MNIKASCVIIVSLGMTACATPGVSPEDANLFQAAGNLQSGEFDRQLQRKQLQLEGSQAELANEQGRMHSLQLSLTDRQQELQALEAELAEIKQQNLALERKISQQRAHTKQQEIKKAELLKKVSSVKKKVVVIEVEKPSSTSASIPSSYKQQISQLKQEIQALQSMAAN